MYIVIAKLGKFKENVAKFLVPFQSDLDKDAKIKLRNEPERIYQSFQILSTIPSCALRLMDNGSMRKSQLLLQ